MAGYSPRLKEKQSASLGQTSTQVPHRIHSVCSIWPIWTNSFTFTLIGQRLLQSWQPARHFSGSALRRNDGHRNYPLGTAGFEPAGENGCGTKCRPRCAAVPPSHTMRAAK